MPVSKHALIRYQALDRCFSSRGRRYFWEDLLEACNNALCEYTGKSKGISRRQLFEDIKYMESDQGWSIPLARYKEDKRVWYRYAEPGFSINKRPLNPDEAEQLKEALLTLNRFKGMPQFQWVDELVARLESGFGLRQGADRIIEFEENPYLRGNEHITTLFHAILSKQVLTVTYQGFKQPKPVRFRLHPYYLKQYNNRWFAFGATDDRDGITNLALDRIQGLEPTKSVHRPNTSVDFSTYFEDVVGVTVPDGGADRVELLVSPEQWPYVETKPLHGSQRTVDRSPEGVRLQLELKINHEFKALLLSMGRNIRILAPEELRAAMAEQARDMASNYADRPHPTPGSSHSARKQNEPSTPSE